MPLDAIGAFEIDLINHLGEQSMSQPKVAPAWCHLVPARLWQKTNLEKIDSCDINQLLLALVSQRIYGEDLKLHLTHAKVYSMAHKKMNGNPTEEAYECANVFFLQVMHL